MVLRRRQTSPSERVAVLERRQLSRKLRKLRGGVGRASRARVPGSFIEGLGHRCIRPVGPEGEVAGAFLWIARQRAQAKVQVATLARRGVHIDGRSKEWVCESNAPVGPLDDAHGFGPRQPVLRVVGGRRGEHELNRGLRQRGYRQERRPGGRRERRQAGRKELLQVLGHGQWLSRFRTDVLSNDRARDLEREQRVPMGQPMEPDDDRARKVDAGLLSQHSPEWIHVQWADGDPHGARQCSLDTQRIVR